MQHNKIQHAQVATLRRSIQAATEFVDTESAAPTAARVSKTRTGSLTTEVGPVNDPVLWEGLLALLGELERAMVGAGEEAMAEGLNFLVAAKPKAASKLRRYGSLNASVAPPPSLSLKKGLKKMRQRSQSFDNSDLAAIAKASSPSSSPSPSLALPSVPSVSADEAAKTVKTVNIEKSVSLKDLFMLQGRQQRIAAVLCKNEKAVALIIGKKTFKPTLAKLSQLSSPRPGVLMAGDMVKTGGRTLHCTLTKTHFW